MKKLIRKLIIPIILLSSLLLVWCSTFDQRAEKEIQKLQNEYNDTSTVAKKLKSDLENKYAHLSYLSWKIANLTNYLGKDSQKVDTKVEDKKDNKEILQSWQNYYQCIDEDRITIDKDDNYTYLEDCTLFEWWCYVRKWDGKECFISK